jgi:hypothetical protein|tara:strand:- start:147 stop:377 length:231 start_codon:yes stop_codon:yes gene_type:complete
MEGLGWLNTLYDVATDKVFTKAPYNAIDSVMNTNLYEVFSYLSWKTAKNEYESAVRDGMDQEQRIKASMNNSKLKK